MPIETPESVSAAAALPPIPAKRYFSIGEVSELCGVKAHVLRYWEQE
ncbi:MAG: MerR family DNA-binding transcriptional regulator, partial [Betaproteobacteria bacterium]|nr:MerR family DNA-binding transcriptional regulator [Betaproteobacteria bacterium]